MAEARWLGKGFLWTGTGCQENTLMLTNIARRFWRVSDLFLSLVVLGERKGGSGTGYQFVVFTFRSSLPFSQRRQRGKVRCSSWFPKGKFVHKKYYLL